MRPGTNNRTWAALLVLALAATVLGMVGCGSLGEGGPLSASGTIEADEVHLAPETGGKVVELLADEGDQVESGEVLGQLDTELLSAQHDQARSAVDAAESQVASAQTELAKAVAGARPEEIAAARAALASAEAALDSAAAQLDAAQAQQAAADANLQGAQAQLQAAQAGQSGAQASVDVADASLALAQNGATAEELTVAEHSVDQAKDALWGAQAQRDAICGKVGKGATEEACDTTKAAVFEAEEQVHIAEAQLATVQNGARDEDIAALQAGVEQAQAGLAAAAAEVSTAQANVNAASAALDTAAANVSGAEAGLQAAQAQRDQAQASLDLLLAGARSEDIQLLEEQVKQAQAAAAAAEAAERGLQTQLDRLTLVSPVSGVVLTRTINVGELAIAGSSLFTLADLSHVTLTVYIPEPDLGRVALGQEAQVTVDSYDDVFTGHVTHIASKAEFTPKNVQTREERANMVFAVEITLDNADGRLLPGMSADAVFASLGS